MRSRPKMTGRTPLSPARMRTNHARNHSPSDWATISGGTATAASAAAVGSSAEGSASARAILSALAIGAASPARSAGGHVIDDALAIEYGDLILGHHPPQMQDGNPVGNFEDVIQVMRDHHDGKAAITQTAHQFEYLVGLHHAKRRGWLIEHDQLRV